MSNFSEVFKAYDVRGVYPNQINAAVVARIGQAYAAIKKPKTIVVGQDVRAHGPELKQALIDGLIASGVDVIDIGVITTDQLYFSVGQYGYDGGISVTASHNPGEYNGLKFSEVGGAPIASETLEQIRDWAASGEKLSSSQPGNVETKQILDDYLAHVMKYIDKSKSKPLKLVVNANFGAVGKVVDRLAKELNLTLTKLNWEEDGSFPKGPPNPLLPQNRDETLALVKQSQPDFGVAWDADADRVFFFTGDGVFVPSAYIIALLAPQFIAASPGTNIVHDVTTAWVMDDAIKSAGGTPVINRTGHTFIKARMREVNAPFAGESSGHYYFKDSFYADNGIAPMLKIIELISLTNKSLAQLVKPLMDEYFVSGEINFTVADVAKTTNTIIERFSAQGKMDKTDGVTIENDQWRFSVRPSNTEPLLRLNAEAKDKMILDELVSELQELINT